ncbi:MAG: aspartate kinase [Planctomycetota bacterium]
MIIMKFGGTSLRDAKRIKAVTKIIKIHLTKKPIVIVSAHNGITEKLISLSHNRVKFSAIKDFHLKIIKDLKLSAHIIKDVLNELQQYYRIIQKTPSLKQLDKILSFGERLSVRIVAAYLNKQSINSQPFDACDIGLITDSHFGEAQPLPESYSPIHKYLNSINKRNVVPVVTGFIGKDKSGNITTLGRNGSDYTATIIAAAINANEVQLWSDSDGIMTADPRIVKDAQPLQKITFDEASELAYYSRRFHPLTLLPAIHKNIPVRILNTYKPQIDGTIIVKKEQAKSTLSLKSIVYKKDVFLITIISPRMLMQYGFLEKIFRIFAKYKIVIDMIATSEISVSVTTDRKLHINETLKEISQFARIKLDGKQAIICIIGEDIKRIHGLSGDIFVALKNASIEVKMISQGATRTNIAFLIDNSAVKKAVTVLHKALFNKPTFQKTCSADR